MAKTRVASRHGRVASPEVLAAHVGRGVDAFVQEVFGGMLSPSRQAEVAAKIAAEATRLLPAVRAPVAGTVEMVRILERQGVRLAICSSSPRQNITEALAFLGLTNAFEVIVSAAELPRGKPHPLLFQTATEALGLAPAEVFAVENSWPGVQSAVAAGLFTIAVDKGCTDHGFRICQLRAESYAALMPRIQT